jgi:hypothetical protein
VPYHPYRKTIWGSGHIGPESLSLALDGNGHLHALAAKLPRKEHPQYPLNRKKGGLHSQPGYFGEEKISCPCQENYKIVKLNLLMLNKNEL